MSRKTNCDKNRHELKPKCNHDKCWDAYFTNNLNKSMAARMLYLKIGKQAFSIVTGYKFTKHFIRFIQRFEKEKYGTISSIDV